MVTAFDDVIIIKFYVFRYLNVYINFKPDVSLKILFLSLVLIQKLLSLSKAVKQFHEI